MFRLTRHAARLLLSSALSGGGGGGVTSPTVWWDFEGMGEDGRWASEGDPSAYLENAGGVFAEPGLVGNCATIPSESIWVATPVELDILGPTGTDDWSLAMWHRSNTLPAAFFENFLGTFSSSSVNYFVSLLVSAAGNVTVNVNSPESGSLSLSFPGVEAPGDWHFYCVRYTNVDGTVYASVDGGTEQSGVLPMGPITVGRAYTWQFGGGPFVHSESVDSTGWWRTHALTPTEIAWLYNSGAGRAYPG